jgi:hypothetical protein
VRYELEVPEGLIVSATHIRNAGAERSPVDGQT